MGDPQQPLEFGPTIKNRSRTSGDVLHIWGSSNSSLVETKSKRSQSEFEGADLQNPKDIVDSTIRTNKKKKLVLF